MFLPTLLLTSKGLKMKKLFLTLLALVVLVGRVEAQSTCFLPSACGTTTFSGGTLTGPLLLPDGSLSAPALAFSSQTNTGIWKPGAGTIDFTFNGTGGVRTTATSIQIPSNSGLYWLAGALGTSGDLSLLRDAANTLALRNGTNAQTFNIYNTYTDASNYERMQIYWTANTALIGMSAAGTGTANRILQVGNGFLGGVMIPSTFFPDVTDTRNFGDSRMWANGFISRSIQGSKSKALTESSATSFTQVAVPQTAGANYAAGEVIYTVYATDGTDSQTLQGRVAFSAVNKAGTETCSIGLAYTEVLAVSTASTLTCTHTCVTGLTDAVQIASNCVSSLSQSTFTIESRLDMPRPNTVTPQ